MALNRRLTPCSTKIKVLHLDFTAREALNTDSRESNSLSEPVVIRVYQLKDRKTFDKTVYQQLLQDDSTILKDDMLASRDVVVKPGGDANLDMPMEEKAQFVAVVGCSAIRIWTTTPGSRLSNAVTWIRINHASWKQVITL
jgi:type VI secretion system VasD/TssJ family lipoprotein